MPRFKLLWFPGTCSRVTLVALEELGVPFTTTETPAYRADFPELLAVNPKGRVPVLLIDDVPFTETPAITTHLARLYPDAGLLPMGEPAIESHALATMSWFAAGLHPPINRMRLPMRTCDQPESFQRIREMACASLAGNFEILEARLTGQEWLYDKWSLVDVYMLWLWFRGVGSGMDPSPFPLCAAHAQRCELRPSVARALDREEITLARLQESGELNMVLPANQVGRTPLWADATQWTVSSKTR